MNSIDEHGQHHTTLTILFGVSVDYCMVQSSKIMCEIHCVVVIYYGQMTDKQNCLVLYEGVLD